MSQIWKKNREETLLRRHGREMRSVIFDMPDGSEADFTLFKTGVSVCTLALTQENNVLIAEQFRPGPGTILPELPGGRVEDGEDILTAAKRELREETGYTSEDFAYIGTVNRDGYMINTSHCTFARNVTKVGEQQLDDGEFVTVKELPLSEFRELLRTGILTDTAGAYMILDHANLL